jgi:hypothetical protein
LENKKEDRIKKKKKGAGEQGRSWVDPSRVG